MIYHSKDHKGSYVRYARYTKFYYFDEATRQNAISKARQQAKKLSGLQENQIYRIDK